MKNILLFLIPTITIAAVISDLGKPTDPVTYPAAANVMRLSDAERAAATARVRD